jgi:hypothetical protein
VTTLEGRVIKLEGLLAASQVALQKTLLRLDTLEQANRASAGASFGGGGGGGQIFLVKGTFSAASGSFPSITPTTQTLDVYSDMGGTLTRVYPSATVHWFFLDPSGTDKLIPVALNDDGSFVAINASCTGV